MSFILSALAALMVGLSKGGVKGISTIAVLFMTFAHGAKSATGLLLPLLIFGDILAFIYYKKHIKTKYLYLFLPMAVIGVAIGTWIGKDVSEFIFKKMVALVILSGLGIMWFWDLYLKKSLQEKPWLSGIIAFGSGLYSMIGNLGGAFANIYFLMTRLPKNEFIGTSAVAFFVLNWIKVPFHIWGWGTITTNTIVEDVYYVVFVVVGFAIGVKIVALINEFWFRRFVYIVTILGALFVLF